MLNINKQENAAKRGRFIKKILQSLYIIALLASSAVLLVFVQGDPVLEVVGIGGFVIGIILGIMVILRK